ncbi:hypothetical protein COV61_04815 [Candidatus Micrarchaeota archaeon CG11_big_fil_rev_8_21_14_0_20_47_5]|nr:MAG: hypothetical protein AUJ17_05480 [Candidatus Micrarchaeota archaeon CG1_02_47_40]PIN82830.1 MAG: hypothetical protein COV61_04815 [Candidatus Micrarchaeota archaeon CG11_big_fil_rev_8_21_14_0_20_47_5]
MTQTQQEKPSNWDKLITGSWINPEKGKTQTEKALEWLPITGTAIAFKDGICYTARGQWGAAGIMASAFAISLVGDAALLYPPVGIMLKAEAMALRPIAVKVAKKMIEDTAKEAEKKLGRQVAERAVKPLAQVALEEGFMPPSKELVKRAVLERSESNAIKSADLAVKLAAGNPVTKSVAETKLIQTATEAEAVKAAGELSAKQAEKMMADAITSQAARRALSQAYSDFALNAPKYILKNTNPIDYVKNATAEDLFALIKNKGGAITREEIEDATAKFLKQHVDEFNQAVEKTAIDVSTKTGREVTAGGATVLLEGKGKTLFSNPELREVYNSFVKDMETVALEVSRKLRRNPNAKLSLEFGENGVSLKVVDEYDIAMGAGKNVIGNAGSEIGEKTASQLLNEGAGKAIATSTKKIKGLGVRLRKWKPKGVSPLKWVDEHRVEHMAGQTKLANIGIGAAYSPAYLGGVIGEGAIRVAKPLLADAKLWARQPAFAAESVLPRKFYFNSTAQKSAQKHEANEAAQKAQEEQTKQQLEKQKKQDEALNEAKKSVTKDWIVQIGNTPINWEKAPGGTVKIITTPYEILGGDSTKMQALKDSLNLRFEEITDSTKQKILGEELKKFLQPAAQDTTFSFDAALSDVEKGEFDGTLQKRHPNNSINDLREALAEELKKKKNSIKNKDDFDAAIEETLK